VKRNFEYFVYEKSKRAMLYCGGSDIVLCLHKSKQEKQWFLLNVNVYGIKSCVLDGYFEHGVFRAWDILWYCGQDFRSHVRYIRSNMMTFVIKELKLRNASFVELASPVSLYSDLGTSSIICISALGSAFAYNIAHRDQIGQVYKVVYSDNAIRLKSYLPDEELVDRIVIPAQSASLVWWCCLGKRVEVKENDTKTDLIICGIDVDLPLHVRNFPPSEISRLRDYDRQFGTG
jgi:hypothetical protein